MADLTSELTSELRDGVLTLTIDRPQARNTITYPMLDALIEAFAAADRDAKVRAIVLTGAGDCFSYGTDLSAGAGGFDADAAGFKPLRGGRRDIGGELALLIYGSTKPVIAAINGTAVGIGVTMILPADIRIASETARFGLPFARRGIIPESCATWFLPRIVGIATAVDWSVTGRIFGAEEALAHGLVRELVPQAEVLFVPHGEARDPTRPPAAFDAIADYLIACGAVRLEAIPHPAEMQPAPALL